MALQDPNLGLNYGWTLGENGWNTGMDANLQRLGALLHLSVASRALTAPPATPAEGDRYLIPAAATGDWTGKTGQIALWIEAAWAYYIPAMGWRCWVDDEAALLVYTAGAWTAFSAPSGGAAPSSTAMALVLTSIGENSTPAGAAVGNNYLIGSSPTGDFAGKAGQIATLTSSGWVYAVPVIGQIAFLAATDNLAVYKGASTWVTF